MGLLDRHKVRGSAARLIEEQAYAQAVREVESGKRRDGLWGKALASTKGDMDAARAKYIELRVQSLIDEARVSHSIDNAIEREAEELSQQRLMEQSRAEKERAKRLRAQEYQRNLENDRQEAFPPIFWFLISVFSLTLFYAMMNGVANDPQAPKDVVLAISVGCFIAFFTSITLGVKAQRGNSKNRSVKPKAGRYPSAEMRLVAAYHEAVVEPAFRAKMNENDPMYQLDLRNARKWAKNNNLCIEDFD